MGERLTHRASEHSPLAVAASSLMFTPSMNGRSATGLRRIGARARCSYAQFFVRHIGLGWRPNRGGQGRGLGFTFHAARVKWLFDPW